MKKNIISFVLILLVLGCERNSNKIEWEKYNETFEIIESKKNDNKRLQFKYIQAVDGNKNKWFEPISSEFSEFDEFTYNKLKPLIFEKSIPEIQQSIISEKLTYELLVKFYLHRIRKIEFNKNSFLNSIISLNPNIIETISITKTIPITPVKLLVKTSERIGITETKYHQFFFLANANIKIIVGANQTAKKLGSRNVP